MYSNEVNLSGSNVMGVLYLTEKYMMPSLAEKFKEYLQKNMDPSNVFSILPVAQKYEEKDLVEGCWKVIDEKTEEAVKSEVFATIERTLLEAVVLRHTLSIEEIDLFEAVDFWDTKKCERQNLKANGGAKRRIIGDEIVKAVRSPTMTQKDLESTVLASDILTKEEIVSLIRHLNSVSSSPAGFPETKRAYRYTSEIQLCCRFKNMSTGWYYSSGSRHVLKFSEDKSTALHGVRLFGNKNSTYSVDLTLLNQQTGSALVSLKIEAVAPKKSQGNGFDYYGIEMFFGQKALLKGNTRYCLSATITGFLSHHGENGVSTKHCSGVTFPFTYSTYPDNETTTIQGQFPKLLFSL